MFVLSGSMKPLIKWQICQRLVHTACIETCTCIASIPGFLKTGLLKNVSLSHCLLI